MASGLRIGLKMGLDDVKKGGWRELAATDCRNFLILQKEEERLIYDLKEGMVEHIYNPD